MNQQINLFNPQFLRQRSYFSAVTMLQGLALVLLGSAGFYGYATYQVQQLARQSEETAQRYAAEQARFARYAAEFSPQQAQQLLDMELKKLEAQVLVQRELLDRLKSGALGNTRGYSGYMGAFGRQAIGGLWLTGFSISGDAVQMSLNGGALRPELVPEYIKRLSREKIMRGKEFATLQMQQHKYEAGKPAGIPYLEFTLKSSEAGAAK